MAHTCEDFSKTIESLIQHPTLQEARRLYTASAVYSLKIVEEVLKQEHSQVGGTNRHALNKPYRSQVNGLIQANLDDITELPMALQFTNHALEAEDTVRHEGYAAALDTLHFKIETPLPNKTVPIEALTAASVGINSSIAAEVNVKLSTSLRDEFNHLRTSGVVVPR